MEQKPNLKPIDEEEPSNFAQARRVIPITDNKSLGLQDSNFIFSFGKAQSGKSVILASMLYYMNAVAGTIRPKISTPNTKDAEVLLFDMLNNLGQGILPPRTVRELVTRIDLVLDPNNKSKKVRPISLTFLEMAGDDLFEVRRGGAFHRNIDEYLNAEIPITFLLVTDYDNAAEDDALMFAFIQKLEKERRKFKRVNAILIITKWDKSGSLRVQSEEYLNEFIKTHMPMTNSRIDTYELSKTYYTIGRVMRGEDGNDQLDELNLSSAGRLTKWLYKSITGIDMDYEGTFWERLFGK